MSSLVLHASLVPSGENDTDATIPLTLVDLPPFHDGVNSHSTNTNRNESIVRRDGNLEPALSVSPFLDKFIRFDLFDLPFPVAPDDLYPRSQQDLVSLSHAPWTTLLSPHSPNYIL